MGAKIKAERERRKLTQHQLRALVQNRSGFALSQQSLSKIEKELIKDETRSPAIAAIVKTLGLDERGERPTIATTEIRGHPAERDFLLVGDAPALAKPAAVAMGKRLRANIGLWGKGGLKGLAGEMGSSVAYVNAMCQGDGSLAAWALASKIMRVPLDYLVLGKQPGIPEELMDMLRPLAKGPQ